MYTMAHMAASNNWGPFLGDPNEKSPAIFGSIEATLVLLGIIFFAEPWGWQ